MPHKARLGTTSAATLALVLSGAMPALADDPAPDVNAPVIVSTGLTDGQLVPQVGVFRPTVTDDVGVTRITVALNGDTRLGSCSFSLTHQVGCKALFYQLPNADGSDADVTLQAYDKAGNASTPVTTRVHIDAVAPKGTVTPPAGSSMRSGPMTFTLSGLSDDVVRVDMTTDGTVNGTAVATRTSAPWTFDWDATETAPVPIFRVLDRAGNQLGLGGSYIVSDEPPVIGPATGVAGYMITSLDDGNGWAGGYGGLTAAVTSKAPLARFEIWVDGVLAYGDTAYGDTVSAGWYSAPGKTVEQVELRLWDAAGNEATKSYRVNVDSVPPTLAVTPGYKALVRGSRFTSTATVTDPHGTGFVTLIGPDAGQTPGEVTTRASLVSGRDGERYFTWMAADKLNNQVTVRRLVIVDNTAPSVSVSKAPKNKSKLRSSAKITAKASDRNGIARVQMLVNGKVVSTDSKAGFAFTLNPRKYGKKFTVQLRAYDKAGNWKYSTKRTYRR